MDTDIKKKNKNINSFKTKTSIPGFAQNLKIVENHAKFQLLNTIMHKPLNYKYIAIILISKFKICIFHILYQAFKRQN